MDLYLLDKIIDLGNQDEEIRVVILEGSIAASSQVDELSDYDINIFANHYDQYLTDDGWMDQFGEVLLYQKEQILFYETIIPSRLVLYRDSPRLDFSFWDVSLLADISRGDKVYESYKNGYRVLLDKDHLAEHLKLPSGEGFIITPPGRDEFLQTIYDFWFEAYCVAKYLYRGDLWYAKLIENRYIKDHLFKMALWDHQAGKDWIPNPLIHLEGKRFERWAPTELIQAISQCFSVYRLEDTWDSLFAMVRIFNRLARQTSSRIGIPYPEKVEWNILNYLDHLKNRGADKANIEGKSIVV